MRETDRQSVDAVVILPSFNSGAKLLATVRECLSIHHPVLVVIDGSTDGSDRELEEALAPNSGCHLLRNATNSGKGASVLAGLDWAAERGIRFALVMDADGQHPADAIPAFLEQVRSTPDSMVLGVPIFGPDAPPERVRGRKIGNWWVNLETLWGGIGDSLFGFRAYPVEPARKILHSIRTARRFDFDTELVVRLYWAGVRPCNQSVPVFYPSQQDGGVTHFCYLRDNLLLIGTHLRLVWGALLRLPRLLRYRSRTARLSE